MARSERFRIIVEGVDGVVDAVVHAELDMDQFAPGTCLEDAAVRAIKEGVASSRGYAYENSDSPLLGEELWTESDVNQEMSAIRRSHTEHVEILLKNSDAIANSYEEYRQAVRNYAKQGLITAG